MRKIRAVKQHHVSVFNSHACRSCDFPFPLPRVSLRVPAFSCSQHHGTCSFPPTDYSDARPLQRTASAPSTQPSIALPASSSTSTPSQFAPPVRSRSVHILCGSINDAGAASRRRGPEPPALWRLCIISTIYLPCISRAPRFPHGGAICQGEDSYLCAQR